jgi:hypothetical protein
VDETVRYGAAVNGVVSALPRHGTAAVPNRSTTTRRTLMSGHDGFRGSRPAGAHDPPRCRRRGHRRLLTAMAAAAAIAACSPEATAPVDPAPSVVTVSPSPADPVAAAEDAVVAAYRCMWAAYDQAGRAPQANPDDDRLARCATGDALDALVEGLLLMRNDDLVIEGEVRLNPVVVELSPGSAPIEARIEDCGDSSDWVTVRRDTGEVTDDPRGRQLVIANLRDTGDGVWKVVDFAVRGIGSCAG